MGTPVVHPISHCCHKQDKRQEALASAPEDTVWPGFPSNLRISSIHFRQSCSSSSKGHQLLHMWTPTPKQVLQRWALITRKPTWHQTTDRVLGEHTKTDEGPAPLLDRPKPRNIPIEKQFTTRMIYYMFQKKLGAQLPRIGYQGLLLVSHYKHNKFSFRRTFFCLYDESTNIESRWMLRLLATIGLSQLKGMKLLLKC